MPVIHTIVTHAAPHAYAQGAVCDAVLAQADCPFAPDIVRDIFRNACVQQRHVIAPLEIIQQLGTFTERNRLYASAGIPLAITAARECIERSGIAREAIGAVFFVSSTGFVVPSPDTELVQHLGLSPAAQRTPIFGWGCAGGAAGIAQAAAWTRAHPDRAALLVNLELCSLAHQPHEATMKALIGSALFNDGATATLIVGDAVAQESANAPRILGSHRHLFAGTRDLMGWDQQDDGLHVILSPDIPSLVEREVRAFAAQCIAPQGTLPDLAAYVCHPGGPKVLMAMQAALQLGESDLTDSWNTLRAYGNMSSCSILFALHAALRRKPRAGGLGLLMAFGPGFCAEGVVVQW